MAELAVAIDQSTSPILLSSAITPGSIPAPYTLDSENILVNGGTGTAYVSVDRGVNGTAAVSHAKGTALVSGWGGGSGAVASVNGQTGDVVLGLAQVLAVGNDTEAIPMVSADDADTSTGAAILLVAALPNQGGAVQIGGGISQDGSYGAGINLEGGNSNNPGGGKVRINAGTGLSGDLGGVLVLAGGDASAADSFLQGRGGASGRDGSIAFIQGGGADDGAKFGGYFDALGATAAAHGKVQIGSDNTTGNAGDVLTGDPTGTVGSVWQAVCTVQTGSPVGNGYLTPLVFDNTALTGGLYCWAATDYVKIGLATS